MIQLLDTTLRDGLQGMGMALSAQERLRLARLLHDLGVGYIEAGFPESNEQTEEFLHLLESEPFLDKIFLFGSTRKKDESAEHSRSLRPLIESPFPGAVIVGKTWPLHLREVLRTSREENLAMIEESVQALIQAGKRVIYDAEHFFDAWREDPDYALRCLQAASGAEWITLCDTNGASLPEDIAEATREAKLLGLPIGIHTHNDCELAVANSLASVRSGAGLVQGTINGVGERCGNANLLSVIANLQLRMGLGVLPAQKLEKLTSVSRRADELLNQDPLPRQAFVGRHAFTHKGGMHAAGMERNRRTFEHIDPAEVGNTSQIVVSEAAGRSALRQKAQQLGLDLHEDELAEALTKIKGLEKEGYLFESADASLYLALTGQSVFCLDRFEISSTPDGSRAHVWLGGEISSGQGGGPVAALDGALRRSLRNTNPELEKIRLLDYKVHIINTQEATGATTRVFVEAGDERETWTAVGVSDNIISASAQALQDAYNYGLLRKAPV